MKAINIKVNGLINPIGIDIKTPIITWSCEGGIKQTGYRLCLQVHNYIIFDSGKVETNSMRVVCKDVKLNSRDQVDGFIALYDENNNEGEKSPLSFEMGLLEENDFCAKWIAGNNKPSKKKRYPVDYFRKSFKLNKNISKARLYISAFGTYDVTINGTRIEDYILAPGVSNFFKKLQYQTYDVTKLLKEDNQLDLRLADGFYMGNIGAYSVDHVFGKQSAIMGQLEVTFTDGSKEVIVTDGSFDWCNDGPLTFADLKDGEKNDFNLIPSYSQKAKEVKKDNSILVATNNVYVKEHEIFKPELLKAKNGNTVYDFKQNIAGYISLRILGGKGEKVVLRCSEMLDENGNADLHQIQLQKPLKGWSFLSLIKMIINNSAKGPTYGTPLQEIELTLSGKEEDYKTSFAIFGFRYVEVIGKCEIKEINSIAVYSDLEELSYFECSNSKVNQLHQNTKWSMKSNFMDQPTDCPTRERMGWTGDAQIFFNTATYLMDVRPMFDKWMDDVRIEQYKEGFIPAVVPYQGINWMYKSTGQSVGWSDAVYLIPYRYYLKYQDVEMLKKSYPSILKYVDYVLSKVGFKDKKMARENEYNQYVYEKGVHLGEWLEAKEFQDVIEGGAKIPSHPEECTAYFYLTLTTVAEIAKILNEEETYKKFTDYAVGVKKAYNALFATDEKLDTDRQAKLVRPLALNLLDGERKQKAVARLKKAAENKDYCVVTGFLSTPFVLKVLSDNGELETAYKMLENTKSPGWLSEVEANATTIWESWEGNASLNHYSPGAVCEWLYNSVIGINIEKNNHLVITPKPGGTLTYAKGECKTVYGLVRSEWTLENNKYSYKIEIPANTTATIIIGDKTYEVEPGVHKF